MARGSMTGSGGDWVPAWQPRVAAGVTALALVAVALGAPAWVLAPLALDMAARALDRREWSWLGRLAGRVAPRVLPAAARTARSYWPPKRFASRLGLAMLVAILLADAAGLPALVGALSLAMATLCGLEAAFGLCVACRLYTAFGRLGWVSACPDGRCTLPR